MAGYLLDLWARAPAKRQPDSEWHSGSQVFDLHSESKGPRKGVHGRRRRRKSLREGNPQEAAQCTSINVQPRGWRPIECRACLAPPQNPDAHLIGPSTCLGNDRSWRTWSEPLEWLKSARSVETGQSSEESETQTTPLSPFRWWIVRLGHSRHSASGRACGALAWPG